MATKKESLVLTISADGKLAEKDFKKIDASLVALGKSADYAVDAIGEIADAAKESATKAEGLFKKQAEAQDKATKASQEQAASQAKIRQAVEAATASKIESERKIAAASEAATQKQIASLKAVEDAQERLNKVRQETGGSRSKDAVAARAQAANDLKAAKAALKVEQDAAKQSLATLKMEAAEKAKMADASIRAAREEDKVKKALLRESNRASKAAMRETLTATKEVEKSILTAQKAIEKIERQSSPEAGMKRLGITPDATIQNNIREIEAARDAALKAENLTAERRKQIEDATNDYIEKERKKLGQSTNQSQREALEQFGVVRKADVEEQIREIRRVADEAKKAADLTSEQRLQIERETAAKIKKLNKDLEASTATSFQNRMSAAGKGLAGVGRGMTGASMGTALASAPVAYGLKEGLRITIAYEQTMQDFKATNPDVTTDEFDKLDKKVRELGATTKFTTGQVAEAVVMLAKNGIKPEDILNGALDATIASSAATDADLTIAADAITDIMNQFKKGSGELGNVADIITGIVNTSKYDPDALKDLFGMGGGVSGTGGLSLEDFATGVSLASAFANSGSDGGTSFKTFMMRLSSDDAAKARNSVGFSAYTVSPEVRAAQNKYGKELNDSMVALANANERLDSFEKRTRGAEKTDSLKAEKDRLKWAVSDAQEAKDYQELLLQSEIQKARSNSLETDGQLLPLTEIIAEIRRTMVDGKTQMESDAIISKVFGSDAIRTVKGLLNTTPEQFEQKKADIVGTSAEEAAKTRMDSTQGDLLLMQSAISALAQTMIESGVIEKFTALVNGITALVQKIGELSPGLQSMISWFVVIVAVSAPFLLILGQMAIGLSLLTTVFGKLGPSAGTFSKIFGGLVGILSKVFGFMGNILKLALGWAGTFLRLGGIILTFIAGITGLPVVVIAAIAAAVIALGVLLYNFGDEIWAAITGAFSKAFEWAADAFKKLFSAIGNGIKNLWEDSWLQKGVKFVVGDDDGEKPQQFAKGVVGLKGPGTGTSDSIPAYLSAGETVHTARATNYWGRDFMTSVNNMDPRAVMRSAPVVQTSGGGRSHDALHPVSFNIGGNNIGGFYGEPNAVEQLTIHQMKKSSVKMANKGRNHR